MTKPPRPPRDPRPWPQDPHPRGRGPLWPAILAIAVFISCIAAFLYTVAEVWQ